LGHRSRCSAQPFVLVVAIFRDKDAGAVLAPLLPLASRVLCATADHPRALPAATLAEAARSLGAEAPRRLRRLRRRCSVRVPWPVPVGACW
jgi:folylpolyglutamate synthase/dihydropteroate synthase